MTPERSRRLGKAHDRLRRILFLLPAAGRPDGVRIDDLCDALEVTREVLLADLIEISEREYCLKAGAGDGLRLAWDDETVRVETTGEFRRPARLDPREGLALDLGLRMLAAEREGEERRSLEALARRLEAGLVSVPEIEFAPDIALEGTSGSRRDTGSRRDAGDRRDAAGRGDFRSDPGAPTPDVEHTCRLLAEAARRGRRCGFSYLKPEADHPEPRCLEPYDVISAAGRWYAIGRDPDRDGIRTFRLDRMADAFLLDRSFEPDPDFDLEGYLTAGHVYRAPDAPDGAAPPRARIRYSRRIARWLVERGEGEPADDGSARAEREVADPVWVSRHILQYGGDAELLGPADLRARVAAGARRAERAHG